MNTWRWRHDETSGLFQICEDGATSADKGRLIALTPSDVDAKRLVALPGLVNAAREAIKAVDNNNRGFVGQMQDLKKALEAYQ